MAFRFDERLKLAALYLRRKYFNYHDNTPVKERTDAILEDLEAIYTELDTVNATVATNTTNIATNLGNINDQIDENHVHIVDDHPDLGYGIIVVPSIGAGVTTDIDVPCPKAFTTSIATASIQGNGDTVVDLIIWVKETSMNTVTVTVKNTSGSPFTTNNAVVNVLWMRI